MVNAQRPYLDSLDKYVRSGVDWLDLGCGHRVVPSWLPDADGVQTRLVGRARSVFGFDCDDLGLSRYAVIGHRVLGGAGRLPFRSDSFDLVTANMVVEHLNDPGLALAKIGRVLRPDGVFLFHTPNVLNPVTLLARFFSQRTKNRIVRCLEGRAESAIFPMFYRMNRIGAIRHLAEEAGLSDRSVSLKESSAQTLRLGPFVVCEMFMIRLARLESLRCLRSNIIAVLQKPGEVPAGQCPCKAFAVPPVRDTARAA